MAPGRTKLKTKGEALDASEARELINAINNGEQLPHDSLQKVFQLLQPPCPPNCGTKGSKGNKDNPQCFCALLPPEGSHRKKGLWQKEPVLGQLGRDPADDRRQTLETPAGLRNLGNTCYVNAAMQFLHAIPDFRHALYILEPHLAEQDIVRQLRDLIIGLHFGPRRYVDPEPFANSLQLNHAIQQDGQEFLKLLLTKLEGVFAASKQQEVASVVQRLFRGHFSYVTTCRNCHQPSEGSKRQVEYYELPLQVLNMHSLQQSMVSALSAEELVGDNQYFCEVCRSKCDAERQMRLRTLPPYLCLSLQRFVFDMQTFEKKKALDKLSIPMVLDMGDVLVNAGLSLPEAAPHGTGGQLLVPGEPAAVYELAAVLIHKGTSASHGHYVAHIKVPDTGTWWRFDDETAEDMGPQPTTHPADHGTTAQTQTTATAAVDTSYTAADGDNAAATAGKGRKGTAANRKRGRGDSDAGTAAAGAKRGRKGWQRARGKGRGSRAGKGRSKAKQEDDTTTDEDEVALQDALKQYMELACEQHTGYDAEHLQQFGNGHIDIDDHAQELQQRQQQQPKQQEDRHQEIQLVADSTQAVAASKLARGRWKWRTADATDAADTAVNSKKAARSKSHAAAEAVQLSVPDEQLNIVSGNAYFLVYRQRTSSIGSSTASSATAGSASTAAEMGDSGHAATTSSDLKTAAAAGDIATAAGQQPARQLPDPLQQQLQQLPESVQQQVMDLHVRFQEECNNFQKQKQQSIARVGQRQEEVRTIHHMLLHQNDFDPGRFVSTAWLESWANSEEGPGPVDNGVLLCEHHKLSCDKPSSLYKYISTTAWEALVARHQGGPALSFNDTCYTCLRQKLSGLVSSDALQDLREQLLASLAADEASGLMHSTSMDLGYYVSKTWLTGFTKRQRIVGGSLQPPTAGITCLHGNLAPESISGTAKRLLVSPESWHMLHQVWALQVLRELADKRSKVTRAAAKRAAAAGGVNTDTVILSDGDDDVQIVDQQSVEQGAAVQQQEMHVFTVDDHEQRRRQQQQQQQVEAVEVDMQSPGLQQQQQERQQQIADTEQQNREASPLAAAAAGLGTWQFPLPLDGSTELTKQQLLDAVPSFHSVQAMECEQCRAHLQEAAAGHQEVRQLLEAQKTALGKLLVGSVQENLEPGIIYYLVPNDWVAVWRSHLQAALARKPGGAKLPAPPPPLPDAVRGLLCRCHPHNPGLTVQLPTIVNKRGRFGQADPQKDLLRVITQQDWEQLLFYHSGLQVISSQTSTAAAAADVGAAASSAAAAAGAADAVEVVEAAVEPSSRRSSRGRRRGAAGTAAAKQDSSQEQQLQATKQDEAQLLQMCIASMADTDPGFRGMQAVLHVQAPEPDTSAAAAVTAADAALGTTDGDLLGKQQQVPGVEQRQALPNGHHEQQPQQSLQQSGKQGIGVQHPQQQDDLATQSQHPQQQQLGTLVWLSSSQRPNLGQVGQRATTVDLTATPQQELCKQQADRAASATAAELLAAAMPATELDLAVQAAMPPDQDALLLAVADASAAEQQVMQQLNDSDADPDGLEAAMQAAMQAAEDDWQPEDTNGTLKQTGTMRPKSSRRTARTLRRAAVDDVHGSDSDVGEGVPAVAVSAAAALRGWLTSMPGPCQQTLDADAAARRAAMLVYSDIEVMAELVQQEDLSAAFTLAAQAERKSKRTRKNRQPLHVSSTDTLAQLKLQVFQALYVHPKNQHVYVRGTLLEGDQNTLAQMEVFPDEEIRVVNTNEVPNDDYTSVFDGVATGKRSREMETGFKDTALGSGSGPQVAANAAGLVASAADNEATKLVDADSTRGSRSLAL